MGQNFGVFLKNILCTLELPYKMPGELQPGKILFLNN